MKLMTLPDGYTLNVAHIRSVEPVSPKDRGPHNHSSWGFQIGWSNGDVRLIAGFETEDIAKAFRAALLTLMEEEDARLSRA